MMAAFKGLAAVLTITAIVLLFAMVDDEWKKLNRRDKDANE